MYVPIIMSHGISTGELVKSKSLKCTTTLQYTLYFECYYLLLLNIIIHLLKVGANFGFSNVLSKFGGSSQQLPFSPPEAGQI